MKKEQQNQALTTSPGDLVGAPEAVGPQESPAGPGQQTGESQHPAGWKVKARKPQAPGLTPTGKPNKAMRRLQRQQQYLQETARAAREWQAPPKGPVLDPRPEGEGEEGSAEVGGPQETPTSSGLLTAQQRVKLRQEERRKEEERAKEEGREPERRIKGRPSEYTPEEADVICAWISGGKSLRQYAMRTGRPMETIYRWMREHADFRERYKLSHEDRADTLTDEMLEIADQSAVAPSIEGVTAAKLRVETRKWIASKLHRTKWGDEVKSSTGTSVSIRIGVDRQGQAVPLVERVDEVRSISTHSPAPLATSLIRRKV